MAVQQEELRKIYRFDEFQIEARKQVLLRDGKPVQLNAKAFHLLLALVTSNGRELSKDELMQLVWNDQIVEENNLAVHIYNLRKILGERKDEHRYIITIPGVGYRFAAEVSEISNEPEELFIESHTVSRIFVEEETDQVESPAALDNDPGNFAALTRELEAPKSLTVVLPSQSSRRKFYLFTALGTGLIIAGIMFFWVYRNYSPTPLAYTPESRMPISITRVTNDGHIEGAAVSPDGKFVAYVLGESNGNSLWLRQTGTASDIRLLPATAAEFWGLTFSPDGRFIYYNLFASDKIDVELNRVPSLGGVVEKISNVSSSGIAFSPDGKQIAYIQSDSGSGFNFLVVAEADGSHSKIIARKPHPNSFYSGEHVAWSPDGKMIACLVHQSAAESNYFTVVGINLKDGSEKSLSARRWYEAADIQWLRPGSALLVTAKDKPAAHTTQIWSLPYPEGEPRQLTNDLNHYSWLSVTANGESLAAIQANTINSIFVGKIGSTDFKEIASEVGELNPLAWSPNGKIVFRSSKDGIANLWMMNPDGSERQQLTLNSQVDFRGLAISPDGKFITFASWRSGKLNLWRVDADGSNLMQLTDGDGDAYPRCTPDGAFVIYQSGIFTKPRLCKIPLAGGPLERLTEFNAKWAAISHDGNRLSFFQMVDEKWRIGILSASEAKLLQRLDVPVDLKFNTVFWSPDDQSLLYIGAIGNVGNIRSLPLDGSPAKSLTNFTTHQLSDFSLSPDGKQVAIIRSRSISDVVLIENVAYAK